ncbi:hypothetical protein CC1G_01730 [Coprinopsis cinerea okayama7|uniref:Integral membrane protein n=1 Tax=Coprinopsis cinerea (strain Okayama-7 / 130 / ATCC MYA-4618 / FGSC 9003) TaxID=240176 RepID=A8N2L3_COPC7|nr:hypothetical protein CC1G_01730 [Coprinopsis cinerea okayama7\|eukprot:XP_001829050.1 hypothetical protein CC1G_01730 [Coprinopsis cinerea okayama7\
MSAAPAKPVHPLLAKYLTQLALHPLRTKAITTATLCFLQEVLGSNLAGVPARPSKGSPALVRSLQSVHVDLKAVKMALYGFLVSAPLSHVLVSQLQKAFAGKDSPAAKLGQIVANNLLVAPIQTSAYLASMAVINGATSIAEIVKTIKAGFFSVIRVSWIVSPLSLAFAQRFVPVELWVPFFNAVQFVLGTYFNYRVKQLRLAALKKEQEKKDEDKSS